METLEQFRALMNANPSRANACTACINLPPTTATLFKTVIPSPVVAINCTSILRITTAPGLPLPKPLLIF